MGKTTPQFFRQRFKLIGLLLCCSLFLSCTHQPELPPLSQHAVILAFGDSLTYGAGAKRHRAYPARLSQLTGLEVVNAGISGEVSAQGLSRLPQVLEDVQPELMILCHGGNDLIRKLGEVQAENNIRQMIRLAKQNGISVILVAVPKPGVMLSEPTFYQTLAEEHHIPLITDMFPQILRKPSLKSDLIHPNAKGYEIMANTIYAMMEEVGSI